ncbi:MAG: oxygenase MpaB family protein [Polyangiales bacterium]
MRPRSAEQGEDDRRDDEAHARCVAFARERAAGEVEGVFGPGSFAWERVREPVTLVGGLSAVLLQMAHPGVCAGVSEHSTFNTDLIGRGRRTTAALYALVFGTLTDALRMSARLHAMHRGVRGVVTEPGSSWTGRPYRANDQPLLAWVAATTYQSCRGVFERFVRPMERFEREADYAEFKLSAALTGVLPETLPETWEAFTRWYDRALDDPALFVGPSARAVAESLRRQPPVTRTGVDLLMTTAFLPERWRRAFDLPWGASEARRFELLVRAHELARRATPEGAAWSPAYHRAVVRVAASRGSEAPLRSRAAVGVADGAGRILRRFAPGFTGAR